MSRCLGDIIGTLSAIGLWRSPMPALACHPAVWQAQVIKSVGSPLSQRSRGTLLKPSMRSVDCRLHCTQLRVELQTGTEQLLLVCSDGVWEFITAQEAHQSRVQAKQQKHVPFRSVRSCCGCYGSAMP